MAKNNNLTDFLTDVADAIRAKKGTSTAINPQDFSSEIANLGSNKLAGIMNRTVTTLTASDLAGATQIPPWFCGVHNNDGQNNSLISVEIPSGVTRIGESAFLNCDVLTSVTIPNTVTEIQEEAFQYCGDLASITLPNSITSLGDGVFEFCVSLASINIPTGLDTIPTRAFRHTSFSSITIPNSVLEIMDGAFMQNSRLTSITIPNSVGWIGSGTTSRIGAFQQCTSLSNVSIGTGIQRIYPYTFYGCSSLTEMTILATTPPTLDNIDAISTATTTIYVPAGTKSAYESATNWSALTSRATNPVTFVELSA